MIWAFFVCLGGLILASVLRGKEADLRRAWTLCCWFPLVLIIRHLLWGDGGRSDRMLQQLNTMTEIVGWIWVIVFLLSMKAALTSSRE